MVFGVFGKLWFLNINNVETIAIRVQSYTFLGVISNFLWEKSCLIEKNEEKVCVFHI